MIIKKKFKNKTKIFTKINIKSEAYRFVTAGQILRIGKRYFESPPVLSFCL